MSWKRRFTGKKIEDLPGEEWKEMEEYDSQLKTTEISNKARVKRVSKQELFHRKTSEKETLIKVSPNTNRKHNTVKLTITDEDGNRKVVHKSINQLMQKYW